MSLSLFILMAVAGDPPTPPVPLPPLPDYRATSVTITPLVESMKRELANRWHVNFSHCAAAVGEKVWVEFEITPTPQYSQDEVSVVTVHTKDRVFASEGVWYCFNQTMRLVRPRWPTTSPTYTVEIVFEETK